MKNMSIVLLVLLLVCGLALFSFAQTPQTQGAKNTETAPEFVKGKIVSINAEKNEIVVKVHKTGAEKTIAVDPKVISSLKADEMVKIMLKPGTNVAEKVSKIVPVTPKTAK